MGSIADNLSALVQSKADIKAAIIRKGVTPEGGLVTYADAIDKIEGYGGSCTVTFPNDVVALLVKLGDSNITSEVVDGNRAFVEQVNGDLNIKITEIRSITYILSHVTSSNMTNRIPGEWEYQTIIAPDDGYEWDQVIVMMNGNDVTSQVFNYETGAINIDSVTGDITISVSGKLKTYNVTNTLSHSSNSNSQTKITHGDSYIATITPDNHYALTKVYVEMDGNVLYDETWDELEEISSFDISIPQVIEDINIIVETKYVVVVTLNVEGATVENTQTKYRLGEEYYTRVNSQQYYDFKRTECSDSSAVISAPNLNESTRVRTISINIKNLTEDVVIDIVAERMVYRIINELTNTSTDNEVTTILEGESYTANLTPIQWHEVSTISIREGGRDTTDTRWTDTGDGGVVYIEQVFDLIQIHAESTNIVYTVTNNLTGITTDNQATTALAGQPYNELLTIDYSQYDDINITVTMGGETIDYHNMSNGEINIPIVRGDIVVTASGVTENLSQYSTLDHYTMDDIEKLKDGQKIDVIMASPRIDHGYVVGYDGTESKNFGNGYKNLIRMQHEIAPVSTDNTYIMELSKRQDTKMEDVYGPVVKTFSVSGSFYNSTITKLNSSISGYDLYGCASNFSNGNATRTGTVTVRFSGKQVPRTIYLKAYSSRGNNANYHCYINYNGSTVCSGANNQTLTSLSNFTAYDINSTEVTFAIEGKNNSGWTANNVNVWFLVPNNITEIDVTGQQEVPDGLPYFALTTKLGGVSVTDPSNMRATPDGFNIFQVDSISHPNQTAGLLPANNPCVFKFVRISDNQLLSSGSELGPLQFDGSESDKTVWYLYKPNSAGYTTSTVTVTNRLTNATTSNSSNSVMYGGSYNTTLSWEAIRTPYRLSVTMCGHDITDAVYNPTTKVINIPYVIGPIVVLVACVDAEDMKKVTYTLTDVAGMVNKTGYSESMSTDDYDAVLEGDTYTAQPSFEGLTTLSERNFNMTIEPSQYKYMKITECYAEMGGQRYDDIYDASTNTITIPEITGNCHITVSALYVVGYVDDTYYDVDKSGNHIYVEADALGSGSYTARYSNIGESLDDYNNITTFNI